MITNSLDNLEAKLDQLIHLCTQLTQENKRLRETQREIIAERDELANKNNIARSKVENMLNRLKQLEAATYE
jgi:cell division protein ZapB